MRKFIHSVNTMIRRPPEVLLRSGISSQRSNLSPSEAATCAKTNSLRNHSHKAAVCTELGKPLQIQSDLPTMSPDANNVLVAVRSAGINFADILTCAGLYQEKPSLPFIPGSEISGCVVAVGEGVSHIAVNDRVVGLNAGVGAFAEYCMADSKGIWKIPDNVSYTTASAMLVSYCTAFTALARTVQIKPGETLLVTAAAGALGLAAVDLGANTFGCKVIGACGGEEKAAVVKDKGAHYVIDYTKDSLRDKVKEITNGKGADVILDPVGGKVLTDCIRSVAFEGRIVTLGYASGEIPKIPANLLLVKSCSVMGLYWGSFKTRHPAAFMHSIDSILRLSREDKIHPHVSKSFPLEQVNEAFQYLQSRKSTGKVAIEVSRDQ